MNGWDYLRAIFYPYQEERVETVAQVSVQEPIEVPKARAVALTEQQPLPAGRVSLDHQFSEVYTTNYGIMAPSDHESFWRLHEIDVSHLDSFSPQELLDMLIDISPEISKAVWDFHRLCNPGYECKAYAIGKEKVESEAGKQHIDGVFSMLRDLYGSVDVLIGRYFMGAFMRGAFAGEIVLDGASRETADLVAPDPYSIRFRKRRDSVRGLVWEPGQMQNGEFVSLDIPTFRYIPVDPAPASPYGRSLAAPSLFTTLFILGLMHDIKRVVMQQGYRRMDIEVNMELAQDAFAVDPQGYDNLNQYVAAAIAQIRAVYARLKPDDAFIHTDIFKLNQPQGTVSADSIGAIDLIIARLEKMVTRALKSNSLIMDTENSTSETDSNRRWEIHAAGVRAFNTCVRTCWSPCSTPVFGLRAFRQPLSFALPSCVQRKCSVTNRLVPCASRTLATNMRLALSVRMRQRTRLSTTMPMYRNRENLWLEWNRMCCRTTMMATKPWIKTRMNVVLHLHQNMLK